MNERFYIELTQGGDTLRVEHFSREGVVIQGESDTFPRRAVVNLRGASTITQRKLREVQRRERWPTRHYELDVFPHMGRLGFRGATENGRGLPSGDYRLNLQVEDLRMEKPKTWTEFYLPENDYAVVPFSVRERDQRQVVLTESISDSFIEKILSDSRIEGMTALQWLKSPRPRATRKACLLNALAVLRAIPPKGGLAIRSVRHVFFAAVDRLYAVVDADFRNKLDVLTQPPGAKLEREARVGADIHYKLPERVLGRPLTSNEKKGLDLRSYRQLARPSLQAVSWVDGTEPDIDYVELDIDLANPWMDVWGFLVHFGELLDTGRTDHLTLRDRLANTAAGEFLFYTVVNA